MIIKKLKLNNFRSAKNSVFDFSKQLNLFVGVNGSGKSTILDALSISLSWLVKRIEQENANGFNIPDSSLSINQDNGYLELDISEENTSWQWLLTKTAKGKTPVLDSSFDGVDKLAEIIREKYKQQLSWPVIVYYPVNRMVNNITPNFPDKESIYNLDVFENALDGVANYQSFFEWFRVQDDILNEESTSRSKWVQKNKVWIKKRTCRLLGDLRIALEKDEKKFDREEYNHLIHKFENDELLYKEPQLFFLELSHIMNMMDVHFREYLNGEKILHDLEYMFHKMGTLSRELKDNLIDNSESHKEIIFRIMNGFKPFLNNKSSDNQMLYFLWQAFEFALLLSLWWLSDKGKQRLEEEIKVLGNTIVHSNLLTSQNIAEKLTAIMQNIIKQDIQQQQSRVSNEGQELHYVTHAIEQFLPEYNHLRVKRVPRPHMLIEKNGETFDLEQLSDGEKNLIALVGDIARRLAIANPKIVNPLEGQGIILIDEIDLHLHPKWQRLVIPKLLEVFPNCQFFISTHSPQILSHVKPENVFLLEQAEEGLKVKTVDETYGMSLDRVVELIMNDESRPESVQKNLDKLFELIERKKINDAKKLITELTKDMKTDPEIIRAATLIRQEEMME